MVGVNWDITAERRSRANFNAVAFFAGLAAARLMVAPHKKVVADVLPQPEPVPEPRLE